MLIANQRSTLIKICDQRRVIQGKEECKHIMLTAQMCNAMQGSDSVTVGQKRVIQG